MSLSVTPIPDLKLSPVELLLRIPAEVKDLRVLISDGSPGSRWSMIAAEASQSLEWTSEGIFLQGEQQSATFAELFAEIQRERALSYEGDLPFVGGAIGTLDYELGYHFLELEAEISAEHPLASWCWYDQVLIYDHTLSIWTEVLRNDHQSFSWEDWIDTTPDQEPLPALELSPQWDEKHYHETFAKLHEAIRMGELYQGCLTFPFVGAPLNSPKRQFAQAFNANLAPMAAYIEQASRQILSLSPERFLHWDGQVLETKPIKGTRARGKTAQEEQAAQQSLLEDPKEQAELNMITDLLRNDLARVCKPGTVEVVEHQALLECPTVWHTFSHIRGKTRTDVSAWDIIEATFPGGSISGCPKRHAVELLKSLEISPRGIYTGSIGYVSDHGRMDLNIAIRTLEARADKSQAGFGGGIVFDSQAQTEYRECLLKASSWSALW